MSFMPVSTRSKPPMEKIQETLDVLVESNKKISSKVDKIDILSQKLDCLTTKVESFGKRLDKTDSDLLEQKTQQDAQELRIKKLEADLKDVLLEIDQLENRSRRHNQRLLNLLEKSKSGTNMSAFLAATLPGLLRIQLQATDTEVAHRIGSPPAAGNTNKPHTIIFKLHHFQKKQVILAAAQSKELKYEDHQDCCGYVNALEGDAEHILAAARAAT